MRVQSVLAVSAWAVFAIALSQQQIAHPLRRSVVLPRASERIDSLQRGFQSALDDLTMTKLRVVHGKDSAGRPTTTQYAATFGLRREPSALISHNGVFRDTGVSAEWPAKEGPVEYYALSCLGKPLTPGTLILHKDVGSFAYSLSSKQAAAIVSFAKAACAGSTAAHPMSRVGQIDGCYAETRPLVLSKPECLACHKKSKVGDPMAILLFRVVKRPPPPHD